MHKILVFFTIFLFGCVSPAKDSLTANGCYSIPDVGHCRAVIPKYFYDKSINACKVFYWGGCGGNAPFDTQDECQSSCELRESNKFSKRLTKSLNAWDQAKIHHGQHYKYSVFFSSWVGFGSNTTIFVSNNRVTQRSYRSWDQDEKSVEQWVENDSTNLGSHQNGAKPKTIDELYKDCNLLVLSKNTSDNNIYLSFDGDGIVKQCQFSPKNCADDCNSGVTIENLIFEFK